MRDNIYWVIPKEEDQIFQQGEIWHRKIWLTKSKYIKCFKKFQARIKNQKENYQLNKKEYQRFIELQTNRLKEQIEESDNLDQTTKKRIIWLLNNFTADNIKKHLDNDYSLPCPSEEEDLDYWKQRIEELKEMEELLKKHEIYLTKQTRESIVFNYHVPDNIIISVNDYLFNYQNVWYEVSDYQRKSWNVLEITTKYSIYWNDYWYLLNANANGIIHNFPSDMISEEVCMCPSFTEAENIRFSTFLSNYELKFSLWMNKSVSNSWYYNLDPAGSDDPDFPWFKIGPWEKVGELQVGQYNISLIERGTDWLERIGNEIKDNARVFSLTSSRVKKWSDTSKYPNKNTTDTNWQIIPRAYAEDEDRIYGGNEVELVKGKIKKVVRLPNFLDQVFPQKDYFHCQANHVWASIHWREQTIWKGNYYHCRELKIIETSNLSGTEVSFHVGSQQIASVKESVLIKAGSDKEGALSLVVNTIINTATAAGVGFVKNGPVGAMTAGALTFFKTTMSNTAQAVNGLTQSQNFHQEYTVDEFQHKYTRLGKQPIQITLEINDELNNRYLASKVIKQGGENNQYFNVANFGPLLDSMGYRKFKFHTLNMKSLIGGNSSQKWFLEQLENGVQLVVNSKNLIEWYQLKLPRNRTKGLGSSCPGDLDTIEVKTKTEILTSFDPSKAKVGYVTYFRVPNDNLYREMAIGKFSTHHNGPGGSNETGNTKFSDGKNQVCWGCGLDQSRPHIIPITTGGEIFTYFDSNASSESHITVPDNCTLIVDAPAGNIRIEKSETVSRHVSGQLPKGFSRPPENYIPTGSGLPEDIFDPDTSPDINEPDTIGDPGLGEPEMPSMEPDIVPDVDPMPDIDPTPEVDPTPDPEPDLPEIEPGIGEVEKPEDFD